MTACAESSGGGAGEQQKTSLVIAAPSPVNQFIVDGGGGAYLPTALEIGMNINSRLISSPYVQSRDDTAAMVQQFDTFEGSLAESYEVSPDGLVYTFKLREDVVSQAGNPFTADDVIWSFEAKYNTRTAPWPNLSDRQVPAAGIVKIDNHTVSFTLTNAAFGATFLSILSNIGGHIYDSRLLRQQATPDDPYGIAWANAHPTVGVSYGPYVVSEVTAGTEVQLTANANYFGPTPAIETVIYRFVEDSATRAQSLRSGAIDIAQNLTPADQADLENAGSVKVFDVPTVQYAYLIPVANKAPFNETSVRTALALAIPYDRILQDVYLGRARQPRGLLNPGAVGYTDADLPTHSFDPERARQLLAESGHADGVSFTLTVSSDVPDTAAAAVQLQSAAKAAGFDVEIQQVPASAFSQGLRDGAFQAVLLRDSAFTQTPSYELDLYTNSRRNSYYTKWADPVYDQLRTDAYALGDPFTPEAGAAWSKAEGYLLDQGVVLPYAQVKPSVAVGADVAGWAWRTDDFLDLAHLSFG